MKLQNLILSIAFTGSFALIHQTAEAQSKVSFKQIKQKPFASQSIIAPPKIIRWAKGSARFMRTRLTIDPQNGAPTIETVEVCKPTFNVPVAELRIEDEWGVFSQSIICEDILDGVRVSISANATLANMYGKSFGLKEDVKVFRAFANTNVDKGGPSLPPIPFQVIFTPDLNQRFFGVYAGSQQYYLCTTEDGEKSYSPQEAQKHLTGEQKCRIVNPVAYSIQWNIEDAQ